MAVLTDEQVEDEIVRLKNSMAVKLAKKEEAIRNRRRQYMYTLRVYEKRGKELISMGFSNPETLEEELFGGGDS